ncbi:MAG: hypothetical protein ACKOQM_03020 [Novosphingobium sp.]
MRLGRAQGAGAILLLPALAACATITGSKAPLLPKPDVLAEAYYQYRNAGCVALIDACDDSMAVSEITDEIGELKCERTGRDVADCRFTMNSRLGLGQDLCRMTLDWHRDYFGRKRWLPRRVTFPYPVFVPQLECKRQTAKPSS